jgi:hypothetical protein
MSTGFPTIFMSYKARSFWHCGTSQLYNYGIQSSLSKKDINCPNMTLIVHDKQTLGKCRKKEARKGSEREVEA